MMKILSSLPLVLVLHCALFAPAVMAKKDKGAVVKSDLPGIACDVCNLSIEMLFEEIQNRRAVAPYKKLGELEIQTAIDDFCKPENEAGKWIRSLDIVTKVKDNKEYARLASPGGISKCESECRTIARSCEELFSEEIDGDDLTVALWKNKHSLERLKDVVCKKWTKRCSKPPPALPAQGRQDHAFVELDEKSLQMEKLMADMKSMGMGGMSMYDRDDMENMNLPDDEDAMGDAYDL